MDVVRRHKLDAGSAEATIARLTATIRMLQECYEKHPKNKQVRVPLKLLIDKRKKYLRYLRKWDYKRFEWILEKLDIVFKPAPENFDMVTRKGSLIKLTNLHCEKVRQDRLEAYRKELESKQLTFLEDKIKNLEFIRSEQIACKVPVTIANDKIQEVKKQYQELKKKREDEEEISRKQSVKDDYELNL